MGTRSRTLGHSTCSGRSSKTRSRARNYDLLGKNRPAAWEKDSNGKALTDTAKKTFFIGTWRTYQMSDHFPMWVELKVDFADTYLGQLARA